MIYSDIRSGRFFKIKECLYSISRSSGVFSPIPTKELINFSLTLEDFFISLLDVFFGEEISKNGKQNILSDLSMFINNIKLQTISSIECIDFTSDDFEYRDYIVKFIYSILRNIDNDIENIIIYKAEDYFMSAIKNQPKDYKIIYIAKNPVFINYEGNQVLQININQDDDLFYDSFFKNYRLFELTKTIPMNSLNILTVIANIILLFIIKKYNMEGNIAILLIKENQDLIDAFMIAKKMGLDIGCFVESGNFKLNSITNGGFNSSETSFIENERFYYILNDFSSDSINIMTRDVMKRGRVKINEKCKINIASCFTKELNEVQFNTIHDKKNNMKGTAYENISSAKMLSLYEMNSMYFKEIKTLPLILERKRVELESYDCDIKYLTDFSMENLNSEIYKYTVK